MWTCNSCNEQSEDNFDSCWNCGTARDGTPPPDDFDALKHSTDQVLDSEFAEHFKCCKCEHTEARIKRISTTGSGLSKIIDIQHNSFIAVSCCNCGYTEFFNPEVLEGKKYLGTILDLIFG